MPSYHLLAMNAKSSGATERSSPQHYLLLVSIDETTCSTEVIAGHNPRLIYQEESISLILFMCPGDLKAMKEAKTTIIEELVCDSNEAENDDSDKPHKKKQWVVDETSQMDKENNGSKFKKGKNTKKPLKEVQV